VARNRQARVRDRENRTLRLRAGRNLDSAARDVVADRVRDEVGDETVDQVRIAGREGRFECLDRLKRAEVVSVERRGNDHPEIDLTCSPPELTG
jgi:hypothetical protein